MAPKRSSRPVQRSKKVKSQAKSSVQPSDRPSESPTPLSPKRYDLYKLNRTQLRREAEKRGCGVTTTNKGTIDILREWDQCAADGREPPARGNARAARSNGPAQAPAQGQDEFDAMNRPALREECRKRGLRFAASNEATRKILREYVAGGYVAGGEKAGEQPHSKQVRPAGHGGVEVGLDNMGMAQLRRECERRGIKANPAKKVTIKRLRDHDAALGATKATATQPQPQVQEQVQEKKPLPQKKKTVNPAMVRDRDSESRAHITVGPYAGVFPATTMRQNQVIGDGNCLYRAFAMAFYGDEEEWRVVRGHVRAWYNLATAPAHINTPEAHSRRHLYGALNVGYLDGTELRRLRTQEERGMHRSRYASHRAGNLFHQLNASAAFGDSNMLQVLADVFDVEVFSFAHGYNGEFEPQIRGRFGARQIFLANYPVMVHWAALTPVDNQPVTAHIRLDEMMGGMIRAPITGVNDAIDPDLHLQRPLPLLRSNPPPTTPGVPTRIVVPAELQPYVETEPVEEEREEPSNVPRSPSESQSSDEDDNGGSNGNESSRPNGDGNGGGNKDPPNGDGSGPPNGDSSGPPIGDNSGNGDTQGSSESHVHEDRRNGARTPVSSPRRDQPNHESQENSNSHRPVKRRRSSDDSSPEPLFKRSRSSTSQPTFHTTGENARQSNVSPIAAQGSQTTPATSHSAAAETARKAGDTSGGQQRTQRWRPWSPHLDSRRNEQRPASSTFANNGGDSSRPSLGHQNNVVKTENLDADAALAGSVRQQSESESEAGEEIKSNSSSSRWDMIGGEDEPALHYFAPYPADYIRPGPRCR